MLHLLFGSMSLFTILCILILPYWIPTIVAVMRHVDRKVGIILVNFLLGWTVIGWVGSLVWACVAETEQQARLREAAYANMAAMPQQYPAPPQHPMPPQQ